MTKVSLVKCDSYDKVYDAIKRSIDLIGGLNIPEGSKVLIKPNLLRPKHPKYGVTTNPEVVRAIIKILKENKCKIYVGDSPGFHDALATAKVCGILDLCKDECVEYVEFKSKKIYSYEDAILMKKLELCDVLDKFDFIINVPKLKTHVMMGATLAVKNTFGFMVGLNKSQMHLKLSEKDKFASMIVDINNFVKPCLNIMDGVIGMEGNGPGNGDLVDSGIISASYDSLAMDVILCKVIGIDPILTNKIGLKKKGEDFIDKIEVVGEKIDDVKVKFKLADDKKMTFILPKGVAKVLGDLILSRPVIDKEKCKACNECVKICPAKTIHMKDYDDKKAAWIDKKDCIRCFCCHEICPHDAIDIKRGFIGNVLEKIRKII